MLSIPDGSQRLRLKNWQKCQLMSKEHPSLETLSHLIRKHYFNIFEYDDEDLASWEDVFYHPVLIRSLKIDTHTHLDIREFYRTSMYFLEKSNKLSFQVVAAFQVKPGGDASELHAAVRGPGVVLVAFRASSQDLGQDEMYW